MSLNRLFAAAILIAAGFLLAGCISSATPKFDPSTAVQLLGDGGRFGVYVKAADGTLSKEQDIEIGRTADGKYRILTFNDDLTFTLHRVGQYVVVQTQPHTNSGYDYSFLRLVGGELVSDKFDMAAQDQGKLIALGATGVNNIGCSVDGVSDMRAFIGALKFGDLESKFVREN